MKTTGVDRRRECTRCGHRFSTTEVLKDNLALHNHIIEEIKKFAERVNQEA
jgi:transcriptional regulator NrdR family protein